ncbi:response regulator transcription factor [Amycolatopsis sp. NPDC021455]|uniref:response regulator transcription factor n=1 Tax=Amycolatopsis sp. NPDC021455 TaxID=3154901 RepID=UPI0033D3454D
MRVVIADDSALIRHGLTLILGEAGCTVAAATANAEDLLTAVHELRPDAAVIDVRMPPTHTDEGLRAARRIRAHAPEVGLLMLSQYLRVGQAAELITSGPDGLGYLLKDRMTDTGELVAALRRVAGGGTALDPEVVAALLRRRSATGPGLDTLTPQERRVLGLMAEGLGNSAIAATLVVAAGTVDKHISSIFAKLGLHPGDHHHRRVRAVLTLLDPGH